MSRLSPGSVDTSPAMRDAIDVLVPGALCCRRAQVTLADHFFGITMFHRSLILAIPVLGACAQTPTTQPLEQQLCELPRPQVCTMIYDPVCAVVGDGIEETRASACNACADEAVTGYRSGPCEEAAT